jgi:toxin-antitoxin system PIN domain toxin
VKAALLDVNVLLALAWPSHQHHSQAHSWFAANANDGWATCAVTQLGFIRISSNPAFTEYAVSPRNAAGLLKSWTRHSSHQFMQSPPACVEAIYANALGHRQVTDAWLIEVARQNNGRLVTLDSRMGAHVKAKGTVEVIQT